MASALSRRHIAWPQLYALIVNLARSPAGLEMPKLQHSASVAARCPIEDEPSGCVALGVYRAF
jgi:hypothetical protein